LYPLEGERQRSIADCRGETVCAAAEREILNRDGSVRFPVTQTYTWFYIFRSNLTDFFMMADPSLDKVMLQDVLSTKIGNRQESGNRWQRLHDDYGVSVK
jgi:hypothetical protein